eukprot:gene980-4224_t
MSCFASKFQRIRSVAVCCVRFRSLHVSPLLNRKAGIHPPIYYVQTVATNGAVIDLPRTAKPNEKLIFLQEDIFNTAPWDPTAEVVKDTGGQVAKFNMKMDEDDFIVPTISHSE